MKKKNNPFKMWGSWIGSVIGAFIIARDYDFFMNPGGPNKPIASYFYSLGLRFEPLLIIGFIIIGFLIGWGITIFWRKIK